jgi:hypothetical protein
MMGPGGGSIPAASAPTILIVEEDAAARRLGGVDGRRRLPRHRRHVVCRRAARDSIVVTGFPDPVVRRQAEALDAMHLEKPVDPEERRALAASVLADSVN